MGSEDVHEVAEQSVDHVLDAARTGIARFARGTFWVILASHNNHLWRWKLYTVDLDIEESGRASPRIDVGQRMALGNANIQYLKAVAII